MRPSSNTPIRTNLRNKALPGKIRQIIHIAHYLLKTLRTWIKFNFDTKYDSTQKGLNSNIVGISDERCQNI